MRVCANNIIIDYLSAVAVTISETSLNQNEILFKTRSALQASAIYNLIKETNCDPIKLQYNGRKQIITTTMYRECVA